MTSLKCLPEILTPLGMTGKDDARMLSTISYDAKKYELKKPLCKPTSPNFVKVPVNIKESSFQR